MTQIELPGDWQKIYLRLCGEVKGRTGLALSGFKGHSLNGTTIDAIRERMHRALQLMTVDGYFDGVVPEASLDTLNGLCFESHVVTTDVPKRAVRVDLSIIYKFLHLCCWQSSFNAEDDPMREEVPEFQVPADAIEFLSLLVARELTDG